MIVKAYDERDQFLLESKNIKEMNSKKPTLIEILEQGKVRLIEDYAKKDKKYWKELVECEVKLNTMVKKGISNTYQCDISTQNFSKKINALRYTFHN